MRHAVADPARQQPPRQVQPITRVDLRLAAEGQVSDEWVDIADFQRGIAVVAALIGLWCGVQEV